MITKVEFKLPEHTPSIAKAAFDAVVKQKLLEIYTLFNQEPTIYIGGEDEDLYYNRKLL